MGPRNAGRIVALLACGVATAAAAGVPEQGKAELPAGARMILLERMGNHRQDMTRLHAAVLFLEHDAAKVLAGQIAAEPRLAQPMRGASAELNSLVPPRFFELQDELRQRAQAVARAAAAGDDAQIAKAYGALTETCVRCHAAFLNEVPGSAEGERPPAN